MSSIVTSHAHAGASTRGPSATPVRQYSRGGVVRDLRRLSPVIALMRHEVLEDHLLEVAVRRVELGELLQ